ncbi:MAG: putative membrane protein [Flammeovirgaceae bacterium]|jgi:uncharacterized membrane protein
MSQLLKHYLNSQSISFTNHYLNPLPQNSLSTLSNLLFDYKIPNMTVRLEAEDLSEIPYPAIAYLADEEFVVLEKLTDNKIYYQHPKTGSVSESLAEFSEKWSGITILAEPDSNSKEPNYKANKKAEKLGVFRKSALVFIALLILGFTIFKLQNLTFAGMAFLKVIGIALSVLLLIAQSDQNNSLVQKLCNVSKKTSCQTVLDSKASKLFGWLSLSELGLVYFSGGFFVLLLSSFWVGSIQTLPFLAWLSVLALPYTLFSVYYQKFVVKQWCPLCLGVLVLLWLEFALGFQFLNLSTFPTLNVPNLQLLTLGFAIPTAFWLFAKPWWQKSQQLNPTKQELNSFKMDGEVFGSLLEKSKFVETGNIAGEMVLGNLDSDHEILMITNPFCKPCAKAHKQLESLFWEFAETVRFKFRFVSPSEIAQQILMLQNPTTQKEALAEWYANSDSKSWRKKYPTKTISSEVEESLKRQAIWSETHEVNYTPTFFINGYELPQLYSIENTKFYLREVLG